MLHYCRYIAYASDGKFSSKAAYGICRNTVIDDVSAATREVNNSRSGAKVRAACQKPASKPVKIFLKLETSKK